jgi:phage baseplate assembly protein W
MAADLHLLTDIRLDLRHHELRPVYEVATERRRVATEQRALEIVDLSLVAGRDNLGQAVIVRLLTPRGELESLAHPDYGSRLHELIGRQNTETTRNLAKLHILESLAAEPRIEEVLEVTVEPAPRTRDLVTVLVRVRPVGETGVVTIGPFALELAA